MDHWTKMNSGELSTQEKEGISDRDEFSSE